MELTGREILWAIIGGVLTALVTALGIYATTDDFKPILVGGLTPGLLYLMFKLGIERQMVANQVKKSLAAMTSDVRYLTANYRATLAGRPPVDRAEFLREEGSES